MSGIRVECVMLIKFIWVMLNWSLLKLTEEVIGSEISLHKMTRTLSGRSNLLHLSTLENPERLILWLENLFRLSPKHHLKEYKKGSEKYVDILTTKLQLFVIFKKEVKPKKSSTGWHSKNMENKTWPWKHGYCL
jgi:hypothetical protein